MNISVSHRNLELKAECSTAELMVIGACLESLVCSPTTTLHQVDTYLAVGSGRLKLREFREEKPLRAELIAYHRPSDGGSRWSDYVVCPVQGDRVSSLRQALLVTHDVLAVVDKVRQVGIVGHTRVHLDTVAELGTFVELETVVQRGDDESASAEHVQVIVALDLERLRSVAESYSDLILRRAAE